MEEPEELERGYLLALSLVRIMETVAGEFGKRRME